ncbi:hypothetical protein PGC35_14140 [Psychrobacillus sp. PGGUH221]|uniref:hypothetical protein n=1 Tax=Psychrobacillus sp. PGGUH221 TaxID=3020058 RepID=UPI0035C670FC
MIDIHKIITSLQLKRPIFHSEADFQLAIAWEIQKLYPHVEIRLEYNYPKVFESLYLDVWIKFEGNYIPIELKYKTKKSTFLVDGEQFSLKNHGAQDCGRYDFLKDISRIEKVIYTEESISTGYAIMLTNDSLYWRESNKIDSVDAAFKIHEGRKLSSQLSWGELASAGTKRGRENDIILEGSYSLNWTTFANINNYPDSEFKILIVKVAK